MKGWVGWALLALSLALAIQGYRNSQPNPFVEALAKTSACEGGPRCTLASDRPSKIATDAVRQRFEWSTAEGPVTLTCRRKFIAWGDWSCRSAPGALQAE